MKVYVVRWTRRSNGEEDGGNFGECYTDRTHANFAMQEEFNFMVRDWQKDYAGWKMETCNEDGYCSILIHNDEFSCMEWFVDELEVIESVKTA